MGASILPGTRHSAGSSWSTGSYVFWMHQVSASSLERLPEPEAGRPDDGAVIDRLRSMGYVE